MPFAFPAPKPRRYAQAVSVRTQFYKVQAYEANDAPLERKNLESLSVAEQDEQLTTRMCPNICFEYGWALDLYLQILDRKHGAFIRELCRFHEELQQWDSPVIDLVRKYDNTAIQHCLAMRLLCPKCSYGWMTWHLDAFDDWLLTGLHHCATASALDGVCSSSAPSSYVTRIKPSWLSYELVPFVVTKDGDRTKAGDGGVSFLRNFVLGPEGVLNGSKVTLTDGFTYAVGVSTAWRKRHQETWRAEPYYFSANTMVDEAWRRLNLHPIFGPRDPIVRAYARAWEEDYFLPLEYTGGPATGQRVWIPLDERRVSRTYKIRSVCIDAHGIPTLKLATGGRVLNVGQASGPHLRLTNVNDFPKPICKLLLENPLLYKDIVSGFNVRAILIPDEKLDPVTGHKHPTRVLKEKICRDITRALKRMGIAQHRSLTEALEEKKLLRTQLEEANKKKEEAEAKAAAAAPALPADLAGEDGKCSICLERPRSHALKCGHLFCLSCGEKAVQAYKCHTCRQSVFPGDLIRLFA